jgi:GH25 family lysozyme M1 (1,4-beta-N-acetylmuramidase)
VAAGCAVAGCVFLPHGTPAPDVAPTVEPLKAAVQIVETPDIPLKLTCTSVELNLSVTVCDEQDQVVTGIPFAVTITPASGEATRATDDDANGEISVDELAAGTYTVTLDAVEGYAVPAPTEATVAPRVERVVVDVSKEVVDASTLNAATEDAKSDGAGGADKENSGNAAVVVIPETPTTPTPTVPETPANPETPSDPAVTGYTWRSKDGNIYYATQDLAQYVTGFQQIDGVAYQFSPAGVLYGQVGIDVSYCQSSIDWQKVRAAGITYAIIRLGYRGQGSGTLALDSTFRSHIQGAEAAGIKVGLYFYSTAINVDEAVKEASMCVEYAAGYKISYPIAIDVEDNTLDGAHGNAANALSVAERTTVVAAFCDTIRSAGYTPCVYACKSWLETKLDMSQLTSYDTWLASFTKNAEPSTFAGSYCMWQFTDKGSISGISVDVDLNVSYMESRPEAIPVAEPAAQSEDGGETPVA